MKKKLIEKLSIIGVVAICAGVSIGQIVGSKISYDQYRNELEEAENKAIKKNAGLKKGITACLVMNGILLAAVIVLALRGFGII